MTAWIIMISLSILAIFLIVKEFLHKKKLYAYEDDGSDDDMFIVLQKKPSIFGSIVSVLNRLVSNVWIILTKSLNHSES